MAERRRATDDRIYKAAVIEFGENGYSNTTLANVAKSSGITPGLIVQNFGSKENLYRKIAIDITNKIHQELENYSSTWELRCTSIVENTIKMLNADPEIIHCMKFYISTINSLDTPEEVFRDMMEIYHRSPVNRIIKEAQSRGEVIDGDPYAVHSLFWINMANTICYCFNNKLDYPPTEWFLQIIRRR